MNSVKKFQSLLLILLIASVISTSLHYTDNFLFYEQYPQPEWITLFGIPIAWVVLTAIGVIGYLLFYTENFWLAYLCLAIYSLTGVSSLGHYLYGAMSAFFWQDAFLIWTDALTGLAILGFVVWLMIGRILRLKVS